MYKKRTYDVDAEIFLKLCENYVEIAHKNMTDYIDRDSDTARKCQRLMFKMLDALPVDVFQKMILYKKQKN